MQQRPVGPLILRKIMESVSFILVSAISLARTSCPIPTPCWHKGGDWRVTGTSLRGTTVADSLNPQDCRYTLITRGPITEAHVIGALDRVLSGPTVSHDTLDAMTSPGCRIVSLTVTEKGYGITSDGTLDREHQAIAADLSNPERPTSVIGLIVAALSHRMAGGLSPFTVLSCDNLSHNGQKLRNAALVFARETRGEQLSRWIANNVSFLQRWWIGSRQPQMPSPPN